jgi:hypothetical protein
LFSDGKRVAKDEIIIAMIIMNKKLVGRRVANVDDGKMVTRDFNDVKGDVSVGRQIGETTLVKLARSKTSVIEFLGICI